MGEANQAITSQIILNAKRYEWLRSKFAEGQETYIGEWITSECQLDEYVDGEIAEEA